MKTLIAGADILARKDGQYQVIKNGFLGIDGETIDYIGAEKPAAPYDRVKNMPGKPAEMRKRC